MTTLYFRHTSSGKKYRVVKIDKETKKIVLRGQHSEFEEDYDKERFQRLGYELIKESADA